MGADPVSVYVGPTSPPFTVDRDANSPGIDPTTSTALTNSPAPTYTNAECTPRPLSGARSGIDESGGGSGGAPG
ncbi:hypothetical protein [Streptomyces sp. NPDC000878]